MYWNFPLDRNKMFQNAVLWCQQTPHFKHSSEEGEWDFWLKTHITWSTKVSNFKWQSSASSKHFSPMEGVLVAYRTSQIITVVWLINLKAMPVLRQGLKFSIFLVLKFLRRYPLQSCQSYQGCHIEKSIPCWIKVRRLIKVVRLDGENGLAQSTLESWA